VSIQEPTPIVPPQEPLKGRDPTLAARTMGEGNRTVLPLPLVGHFDTEREAVVTFTDPVRVTERSFRAWQDHVFGLMQFPEGEHEITGFDGEKHNVEVSSHTLVYLTVGLDNDDAPVTHLATLLERLKVTSDEIHAAVNAPNASWEPAVTQCLVDNDLIPEPDLAKARYGTSVDGVPSHVSTPWSFVWRKS